MFWSITDDIFEMIFAVILICSVFMGSKRGFLVSIYILIKNILAISLAIGLGGLLGGAFPEGTRDAKGIGLLIVYILAFVGISILLKALNVSDNLKIKEGLNKMLGLCLGAVSALVIIWSLLAILGSLKSIVGVHDVAANCRTNQVIMQVQQYNPLPSMMKGMGYEVL